MGIFTVSENCQKKSTDPYFRSSAGTITLKELVEALGNDVSAARSVPAAIFAFLKEFSIRYVISSQSFRKPFDVNHKTLTFPSSDNPDVSGNQSPFVRTLKTAMTFGGK